MLGTVLFIRQFPDHVPEDSLAVSYTGGQSELSVYPSGGIFVFSWNHNITPTGTGFQVFGLKGVTNSSPDLGGGIGLRFVF